MAETVDILLRRQELLADFGDFALHSNDLDEVLTEACRLVGEATGTHRAKVLEIQPGGESLLVRAGVGWASDVVGKMRIPMSEQSSEAYAINAGEPVISQDIAEEERFEIPEFMKEAGVVALANVPIFLPGERAYGLLQVDDGKPREFGQDVTRFLRTYATILGALIDRLYRVDELRASEERFRLTVETATDYAIFTTDIEGRIVEWLPGAEAVFGWSADEARGQSAAMIFTPDDRRTAEDKKELETARKEGWAPDVRWHIRNDGAHVFIEGSVWLLRDAHGAPRGFLKIGRDVTERRATQERLRASEERFRQFGEASSDVLWVRNAETLAFEYLSAAFEPTFGIPREEALREHSAPRALQSVEPEHREAAHELLRRASTGEPSQGTYRITRRSDGESRWIRSTVFPLPDGQGQVPRVGGILHDATAEIETQEQLRVVVAELQHRTRNLMGVVAAVARRTAMASTSLEDFTERFHNRLQALSRVNTLLSRLDEGQRVTFDGLLRAELTAHGALGAEGYGPQVSLDGPEGVRLRSATVQTFALALHELATNALKHGALSQPEGRLEVRWELLPATEGDPRLRVDWRERGVAMAVADRDALNESSSPHRGYGRTLIEVALPYQLGAETTFEFGPDGVHCTVTVPISTRSGLSHSAKGGS